MSSRLLRAAEVAVAGHADDAVFVRWRERFCYTPHCCGGVRKGVVTIISLSLGSPAYYPLLPQYDLTHALTKKASLLLLLLHKYEEWDYGGDKKLYTHWGRLYV